VPGPSTTPNTARPERRATARATASSAAGTMAGWAGSAGTTRVGWLGRGRAARRAAKGGRPGRERGAAAERSLRGAARRRVRGNAAPRRHRAAAVQHCHRAVPQSDGPRPAPARRWARDILRTPRRAPASPAGTSHHAMPASRAASPRRRSACSGAPRPRRPPPAPRRPAAAAAQIGRTPTSSTGRVEDQGGRPVAGRAGYRDLLETGTSTHRNTNDRGQYTVLFPTAAGATA
jgi:hypothetical protein